MRDQPGQARSFFSNPMLNGPDSLAVLHILCDGVMATAGKIETQQQHLFSFREFRHHFILARMCNRNYFIHICLVWAVKNCSITHGSLAHFSHIYTDKTQRNCCSFILLLVYDLLLVIDPFTFDANLVPLSIFSQIRCLIPPGGGVP